MLLPVKEDTIPGMRVTGGILSGRRLEVPKSGVRPTQDRVRAALFSIIAADVAGCRFLDMCAGSGAVGIEAWSRGAAHVCWVENNRRAFEVLRRNVSDLCGTERTEVVGMDARRFIRQAVTASPFDIAFCDPQYERGIDMEREILMLLGGSNMFAGNGLLVFEQADDVVSTTVSGWVLADDRRYGGTRLRFWRPDSI